MNIELKLECRQMNVDEYVLKNIVENILVFENIFEDAPENTQFVQEGNETDDRA